MFRFINKLLEKPKKPKEETVSDIEEWINMKKDFCEAEIKPNLHDFSIQVSRIIEKIENELIQLKDAKLKNPNIPEKAMQIMEGNRDTYIKRTKDFLYSLDKDPKDSEDASIFVKVYNKGLDELGKSNSKSNMVLSEFFSDNIKRISLGIKQLENLVKGLENKLKDTGNEGIDRIRELNNQLKDRKKYLKEMQTQLKNLEHELDEEIKKKDNIMKKMEKIKSSSNYKELNSLQKSKKKLNQRNKDIDLKLRAVFSDLETGLKKFSRLSLEQKLIESYLYNPSDALRNDSQCKIVDILQSLKKHIIEEKLNLKPKKREKTIVAIDNLDKSVFVSAKNEIEEIFHQKKEIEEKLTKNTAMNNYAEQEYLHTHSEQKIEQLKRAIDSNANQIKNMNLDDLYHEIKKIALDSLSVRLSLAS